MWIESHTEIWQHPKTRKFARLLGVSVPTAVGHLHGIWYWALSYAQDGVISRFDPEEVAGAALWDGDPAAFIKALLDSGYADETQDGTELHDWFEYTGRLMEQREIKKEQARIRKQRQRDKQEIEAADSHANVTQVSRVTGSDMSRCHASTNQPTNNNPPIAPKGESGGIEKEPNIQVQRFSEFWKLYPKKVGKTAAMKAWKRINPTSELHEKIMQAIARQSKTEQWTKDGGQFIPNPATWINRGQWDDEPPSAGNAGNNPASPVKETWGWENGR